MARDEVEQLEFVGLEYQDGQLVARMRNLDWVAIEWTANREELITRITRALRREPRGATRAALAAMDQA